MTVQRFRRAASLLAATALVPLAQAQAAPCPAAGAGALTVGTVTDVATGGARGYTLSLAANEGVIVDLVNIKQPVAASSDHDDHEHEGDSHPAAAPRSLKLCDAGGAVLAPQPGEVFEKGGSVSATSEGERLRFVAPRAGQYVVSVAASTDARELLVRRRTVGTNPSPVVAAQLDATQKGITSSGAPMVFSFTGTAGQWVQLKSTSEKDTVLRLAGPDRAGDYSVIGENDDSEGLNPMLRRKLPVAGTYYLQVDSLSEEPGEFELSFKRTVAPPPPPPPSALRAGTAATGRLTGTDDIRLYNLPVIAGHSYRLDLTAAYDGVVGIGLPNPVEPEDGGDKPDAGYADIKSQDSGTSGTEKLAFTARSSGQLLVRVKSFGIGETDGAYTLLATDLGN